MASLRAKEYLKEYERDRNSIFVGSIPEGYTEDKLRALFEHYGAIVKITIHQKPSDRNRKSGLRVSRLILLTEIVAGEPFLYGFIEYEDPLAAQHAIKAKVRHSHLLAFHQLIFDRISSLLMACC